MTESALHNDVQICYNGYFSTFEIFVADLLQFVSNSIFPLHFCFLGSPKLPQNLASTPKEIEMVIGILLRIGIVKMNNIKNHRSIFTHYEPIASVMSRNRFQLLLLYRHFVDNDDPEVDKTKRLWKIQSFFKHLPQNCLKLYPEQHQAIDKMSIAYKE